MAATISTNRQRATQNENYVLPAQAASSERHGRLPHDSRQQQGTRHQAIVSSLRDDQLQHAQEKHDRTSTIFFCLHHGLRSLIAVVVLDRQAMVFVGAILTALNQGTEIFHGKFPPALAWKIPLTFLVPFCVSTWGALSSAYDVLGPAEVDALSKTTVQMRAVVPTVAPAAAAETWEVDDLTIVLDEATGDIVVASPSHAAVLRASGQITTQ